MIGGELWAEEEHLSGDDANEDDNESAPDQEEESISQRGSMSIRQTCDPSEIIIQLGPRDRSATLSLEQYKKKLTAVVTRCTDTKSHGPG